MIHIHYYYKYLQHCTLESMEYGVRLTAKGKEVADVAAEFKFPGYDPREANPTIWEPYQDVSILPSLFLKY